MAESSNQTNAGENIRENGKNKQMKYVFYVLLAFALIVIIGLFLLPFLGFGGY
jgi:hypothetical protein